MNASARSRGNHSQGFTLIELLVTIAIIVVLAGLLLPTLSRSKETGRKIRCVSNVRQLGLAAQMYWHDNAGRTFRYFLGATNGGARYWFGWIANGAEGQRQFDAAQGLLFPYFKGRGIETCPSLDYTSPLMKQKATGATFGYGYNLNMASPTPIRVSDLPQPAGTLAFGDAAQVNTWQSPASEENPLLEEWYYVDLTANQPNGHFRHQKKANAVFCDGHVGTEKPQANTLDHRLPQANVALYRAEIIRVR